MQNKKGNVAVIAVIIVIVGILAGVSGRIFSKQQSKPDSDEIEKNFNR